MKGRQLNKEEALISLIKKGAKEEVISLKPIQTVLKVVPQNMGIKSWGLVDFLRKEGFAVLYRGGKRK